MKRLVVEKGDSGDGSWRQRIVSCHAVFVANLFLLSVSQEGIAYALWTLLDDFDTRYWDLLFRLWFPAIEVDSIYLTVQR